MKKWIRVSLISVTGLALLGGVIVVSGIVPITASSGHWPVTRWFLQFSKQRSVATHSLGIDAPKLDDPNMVLRGAGSYQTSCFVCHGSPRHSNNVVLEEMTPKPPDLRESVSEYEPRELFYIVKHGIKFTGMPAWPAQHRDDEVWSVVAFLQKLPDLDASGYSELVWGESGVSEPGAVTSVRGYDASVASSCIRCHGEDGMGRGDGAFPILAGQSEQYLENSLQAFAAGERSSGVMQPIAAMLHEDEISDLADHYAEAPRPEADAKMTAQKDSLTRGEKIALAGDPSRRIPSCVDCHDPSGAERKDAYPILYGQPAAYLALQLKLFKGGHRGGSEFTHLMEKVVERMTPEQMRDVAEYFASIEL